MAASRVWSYLGYNSYYVPYSPDTSAHIEHSYSQGSIAHQIHGTDYRIDFRNMRQTRGITGMTRSVQRTPLTLPSSPHITRYWEYEDRPGNYLPYSIQATVDIELSLATGHTHTIDLSTTPAGIPYIIDTRALHQTRLRYGTVRKIRCVPLPSGHTLQGLLVDRTLSSTTVGSSLSTGGGLTGKGPLVTGATAIVGRGCGPGVGPSPYMCTRSHSIPSSSHIPANTASISPAHFISPATSIINKSGVSPPNKKPTVTRKIKKAPPIMMKSSGSSPTTSNRTKGKHIKCSTISKRVDAPPKRSSSHEDDELGRHVKRVTDLNYGEDGPCPICMSDLSEASGFEEDVGLPPTSLTTPTTPDLCKLRGCGHLLHRACLIMYTKNSGKTDGLTCPTCKKIHGVKTGDMPNGTMTHSIRGFSLPGHHGYKTIEITYDFTPGTHNGSRYFANGFPRTCYVPNSPKGMKVFKLLQVAWERRLTFTIGTSVTTGTTDTVVWNEIHHKTEAHGNSSGHGYPDDNYLDNSLAELAAQGVEEGQDTTENYSSSDEDL